MAQAILAMSGRFFATYAMNTGFQFTVEMLPTQLRGQGMALFNVMSMFSSMASPLVVYSVGQGRCDLPQAVISEKAPFILIAIICFVGAVPGYH